MENPDTQAGIWPRIPCLPTVVSLQVTGLTPTALGDLSSHLFGRDDQVFSDDAAALIHHTSRGTHPPRPATPYRSRSPHPPGAATHSPVTAREKIDTKRTSSGAAATAPPHHG
jgi:hypothetical protein